MRLLLLVSSLSLALLSSSTYAPGAQPASGLRTIDALIEIRHPSNPAWSPDGRRVAFVWNRAGVENVWRVDLSGSKPAPLRSLTRFDSGDASSLFWSADGRNVRFAREGRLWTVNADGSTEAAPLWATPDSESGFVPSPDRSQIAFARDGDIWCEGSRTATNAAHPDPVTRRRALRVAAEFHYFIRAHVLSDAWRRVERFFDQHLR